MSGRKKKAHETFHFSATAVAEAPSTGIPKLRGGQYTAIQDDDGTWCLKDVELFSEIPAETRGNRESIGKAWLESCLSRMREKYFADKQYIAPVHVNHHDRPTNLAGYVVPTRVAKYKFADGSELWTLYGDLFKVPGDVYADIRSGRLCFRSVEVKRGGWENPEIGSLALMADEPPHFQYAMTTIGVEIKRAQQEATAFAADKPFLFREAKFMADDNEKKKKDEGDGDKSAPPFAKDGEEKKDDGTDGQEGDSAPAPGAESGEVLKIVQTMFGELKALLTGIFALQSGQSGAPGGAMPVQMHKDEILAKFAAIEARLTHTVSAASAASTDKENDMPDPKLEAENVALKNEIANFRSEMSTFRKEREVERLTEWAAKELEGYNLTAETKAYFASQAEKGKAEIEAAVKFFKGSGVQKDPPTYTPGVGLRFSEVAEMPKDVADGMVAMSADEREKETSLFRAYETDCKTFGKRRDFKAFKKAEELRQTALRSEQGGLGGLPLYMGRA